MLQPRPGDMTHVVELEGSLATCLTGDFSEAAWEALEEVRLSDMQQAVDEQRRRRADLSPENLARLRMYHDLAMLRGVMYGHHASQIGTRDLTHVACMHLELAHEIDEQELAPITTEVEN